MHLNRHDRGLWTYVLLFLFGSLCLGLWWYGQHTATDEDDTLFLGLIGGSAAIVLGLMQYWLQRDTETRALFRELNATYDKLNNDLDAVGAGQRTGTEANKTVVDYMNLCAEEYFWYKRGRIDGEIWKAWESGMRSRFSQAQIAAIAKRELDEYGGSYYGWEKMLKKLLEDRSKATEAANRKPTVTAR